MARALFSPTLAVGAVALLAGCGETTIEVFASGAEDASLSDAIPSNDFDGDASEQTCRGAQADHTCGGGLLCVRGACACPALHAFCDGACTPTSIDPNNCGNCGVKCTGALGCSAGVCSASCLPGLSICANSCVDKTTDSSNCGNCGTLCPQGQGCVDGLCQPTLVLGPDPTRCLDGAPALVESAMLGGCLGNIAQVTFRWALCSCKDVRAPQSLLVDAYDSTSGPYAPGGLGAGMGANGDYVLSKNLDVWGSLWTSGMGLNLSAPAAVQQDVRSRGPLSTNARLTAGRDAYVGGNVTSTSAVGIGGTLHVPPPAMVGATVTYGALAREPVTVAPPCDCPGRVQIKPIAGAHRPPNNENAAINLSPMALTNPSTALRVDLPCGQYYVSKIATAFPLAIVAHGRTALYVDGDVVASAFLALIATPGAELDVFIAGGLMPTGSLVIGSPNYPTTTRVYVGSKPVVVPQAAVIGGNLYAAGGPVTFGPAEMFGALFASDFTASRAAAIHYDRAVANAGSACPPLADTTMCTTCNDCNNQACVGGKCSSCTSSAQCCAPLVCAGGQCLPSTN